MEKSVGEQIRDECPFTACAGKEQEQSKAKGPQGFERTVAGIRISSTSKYLDVLRVFVIGCPNGDPVVQKALGKINECALYIGQLQAKVEELERLLVLCEGELKKTCSCCATFKDCHLPCNVNSLRTEIEQALEK